MKLLNKIIYLLGNPRSIGLHILDRIAPFIKSDRLYIRLRWKLTMDYPLNLENPQTFSEKIQWLKLYDRKPIYTRMVDKFEAKKYVADIIGNEYIIPTLRVYNSVNEIDFDKLPNQFVLKCTHDSGGLVICRDKAKLDKRAALKKLEHYFHRKYYWQNREWPYKNVKPRIIAEKYIEPAPEINDLPDYKFFCFNGEPKYCQVISGRGTKMCIDFFDYEWKHQPFHEPSIYPFAETEPSKPKCFDEMWCMASKLAEGRRFSRIDFYQVKNKFYFGEITFFPTSGMGGFSPKEWDNYFGEMLVLENEQ